MKFATLLLLMSLAEQYSKLTIGEREYTAQGEQLYEDADKILSELEKHKMFLSVILPLYRSIIHGSIEERDLLIVEALKLCID